MNFADTLRRLEPTVEITALGTVRGLDTTLIPARGYPLELIPSVPLPRKFDRALLRTPARLRDAARAAGAVLERVRAEVVVGFGGYVAAPAYLSARLRGLPVIVHEANIRPGVANRLAAMITTHVYTASSSVRLPHATPIGIPLRPAIAGLDRPALRAEARRRFGLHATGPVLLVTGGSQGAHTINTAVAGAATKLCAAGVQVLHITGPRNTVSISPSNPAYVAVPYVDEMHYAYAAADFAICRSGAMTCAELSVVGLPAAFVPLPERGGEQRLNAEAAGATLIVDDAEFTSDWLMTTLLPILTDESRLAVMSAQARTVSAPDAGTALARQTLAAVARHRGSGPPAR